MSFLGTDGTPLDEAASEEGRQVLSRRGVWRKCEIDKISLSFYLV